MNRAKSILIMSLLAASSIVTFSQNAHADEVKYQHDNLNRNQLAFDNDRAFNERFREQRDREVRELRERRERELRERQARERREREIRERQARERREREIRDRQAREQWLREHRNAYRR